MEKIKVRLTFSPKIIHKEIISTLIKKHDITFNILKADINPAHGTMLVEIKGKDLKESIKYLENEQITTKIIKKVVQKNDNCIDCGECISVCPVKAISLDETWTIQVDSEKCIGCGFCTTTCAMKAITIDQ
ncbi:MAG: 4Fe-4S binding protein [Methanobacteriaceae archaeon]|nr:4Fe-4S binding protein [Methanobacteriaceae archaeon]